VGEKKDGDQGTLIERDVPFSRSLIWTLQASAYGSLGPNAWGSGTVPLYITSNPFLARQYVALLVAYLRDLDRAGRLERNEPVYLFDLGAGCGRFAYLCVRELQRLQALDIGLKGLRFCYVLTENVEATTQYWEQHPLLQPLFETAWMDYACFDVLEDAQIALKVSGTNLVAGSLKNPAILIANYLFDTVPQELYRVEAGDLEEGCVTLHVEREGLTDIHDPALIDELRCSFSYRPLDASPFAEQSIDHRVLQHYCDAFSQATCHLPSAGYRVLENLGRLSGGRFFLLAGDQGITQKEQVPRLGDPELSLHGTFSVPVDYYALGLFFDLQDGQVWRSASLDQDFVVLAGAMGEGNLRFDSLRLSFEQSVNRFEMQDYWHLLNSIEEDCPKPSLNQVLRLVKLSQWDPPSFHAFFAAVREHARKADTHDRARIIYCMERVADAFYPVTVEEGAFFTNLGIIAFEMKDFAAAIKQFARTIDLLPTHAAAWFYMGMCYRFTGEVEESVRCLDRARQLDPKLGS
jgi:tetratricopeptide (TPR) repeat protein